MSESNALAVHGQQATAIQQGAGIAWTPDQVALLKRTVAEGASDDELQLFLHVCRHTGLDPFAKQIYCIMRDVWNPRTRQKEPRMTIQTGIDGFRLTAARTGQLAGISDPEFGPVDNAGRPEWARVVVKRRMAQGFVAEFAHTVFWDEYAQTDKEGKPVSMWAKMPRNQLGKCAESGALRKGFPAELSGVYSDDEMAQAANGQRQEPEPQMEVQQAVVLADEAQLGELRDIAKKLGAEACTWLAAEIEKGIPRNKVASIRAKLSRRVAAAVAAEPPAAAIDPEADPMEVLYDGMD